MNENQSARDALVKAHKDDDSYDVNDTPFIEAALAALRAELEGEG